MNDNEYYSLMNRNSSWQLRQKLKKQQEQKNGNAKQNFLNEMNKSYKNSEAKQGFADAQMLIEKKTN